MRDTALGYRGPGSVPSWLRSRAEHAPVEATRPLWGLLIASTLLVIADTVVSWVAFSQLASRHIPIWRGEWNPLTVLVIRAYGLPGMLAVSAVCILPAWVLMPVVWRIQWDFPESPATQALIRRLVVVPLVAACLIRGGVVGYDVSRFGLPPLGNPSSTGPGFGTAGTPTATLSASPSPSAAASPTSRPYPTPTPTTAPPTSRLTISPAPPGPVTACVGNDATFTVTYVGSANPATITVTSASTSRYHVSLDDSTFGGTESGQIASGTSATVWVQAQYNGASQRNISVNVTGFSQQTMQVNTNGCGGG